MAGRVEEHEVPPTRRWEAPDTGLADQVREEWCEQGHCDDYRAAHPLPYLGTLGTHVVITH